MHIVRRKYNGHDALVATTRQTKTPAVMLVAHIDVVPAPERLFTMTERDGKFFGRGVWDMKFAIASYLALVDELKDALDDYDFGIMISSDEELEDVGIRELAADGFLPKVAILPDGANDWQIETAAKGATYFVVHFTGKTAHGSRPWLGDSVSLKIHRFISDLNELFDNQGPETPTLNISSMEVGKIGVALNRIPDAGRIALDIRVPNPAEQVRIMRELETLCVEYDARLEEVVSFPPLVHDADNQFFDAFAESIQKVTGIQQNGFLSLGASSAPAFVERGVPCILTSPTGGDRHSDDEWLDIASFAAFVPILRDYLSRVATVDNAALSGYNTSNIAEDRSRMASPA